MYDVIFIDDKFEEIEHTFLSLKSEHIRCFYSDGLKNLPKEEKEKRPFKNVRYFCLDFYLENRGIEKGKEKTAASSLAGAVKSFICENAENMPTIIVNTGFVERFKKIEEEFKTYLGNANLKIITEKKAEEDGKKFSILHQTKTIKNEILKSSLINSLRNLIMRETIEVENLVWDKCCERLDLKNENRKLKKFLGRELDFSKKIKILCEGRKDLDDLKKKLENLREERNQFAHNKLDKIEVMTNKRKIINSASDDSKDERNQSDDEKLDQIPTRTIKRKIINLTSEELKELLHDDLELIEQIKNGLKGSQKSQRNLNSYLPYSDP